MDAKVEAFHLNEDIEFNGGIHRETSRSLGAVFIPSQ